MLSSVRLITDGQAWKRREEWSCGVTGVWLRSRGDPETLDACLTLTDSFCHRDWLCMAHLTSLDTTAYYVVCCLPVRARLGRPQTEHVDNPPTGEGNVVWGGSRGLFLSVPAGRDVFEITRLTAEVVEGFEGLICLAGEERPSPATFERVRARPWAVSPCRPSARIINNV